MIYFGCENRDIGFVEGDVGVITVFGSLMRMGFLFQDECGW